MPGRRSSPLFLARASYRRRRLIDAARLLPAAGAFLFLLPVLWAPSDLPAGTGRDTAMDGLYLFAVWALLILAAGLMAPGLSADPPADDPEAARAPGQPDDR